MFRTLLGLLADSKHTKRYTKIQKFIQRGTDKAKIIITLKALVIIINEAYEQEHIQPIEQTKKWCKAKVKILTTSTTYLSTIAVLLRYKP